MPDPVVRLTIDVAVHNPALLHNYAREAYRKAFFGDLDAEQPAPDGGPASLETQVLEALVLANANPSPDEYGIELLTWEATSVPEPPLV